MLSRTPITLRCGRRQLSSLLSLGLTDDQIQYQTLARDFANNELAPNARIWDQQHHFSYDVLRQAAQLGFAGLFVSPHFGGAGLGRLDGAVIFESLATGCISTTSFLTIHNMCCWLVETFASQQLKENYLPRMTNMDLINSYCLTEPGSGSDAASLKTTAVRKDGKWILNGSKAFISGGSFSDVYIVMARSLEKPGPAGISCFLVEKGSKGLSFGALEKKMGWRAQPTAAVIMEDCEIPEENLIGTEGDGFKIAMKALTGGRINIGACSLGGAQACVEKAIQYAGEREQFGKKLCEMQSIQFKIADMTTELHSARVLVRQAAELLDKKDPQAPVVSAMAKQMATDLGFKVCNDALQIHGGYGYLEDYEVERYVRDLRVHQILEGTNEVMRLIISRAAIAESQ